MRTIILSVSLMLIILFQNSIGTTTALAETGPRPVEASHERDFNAAFSNLTVDLSTAAGKSIVFNAVEPEDHLHVDALDNTIPHLVLNRNGVLTPGFERTLLVSVGNLVVPPTGMYVQLVIETQHGDPDLDRRRNVRVRVSKETSFIPYNALTQQGVQVEFRITFDPFTELPHKTIQTPTDYYRYRIVVTDPQGNPLHSYAAEYAFLMENQWRVPLPPVLEATPGAAPSELVIYYYDMIPFQRDLRDPRSRIPRQQVNRYIQTELIPAMVEAYQVQSNVWGFPWYEEWHNFRREEDPKTLSVALGEYQIWFHGQPPSLGHSMISIRVDGTAGEYDNLTDGIISVFHHELFHNHQRNMSLHYVKHAAVAGKDQAWMMFSEGTAVLASAVGQPEVQLGPGSQLRSYLKRASAFLGSDGAIGGGLNKSYRDIPYHTAIYWRFLYEKCGGLGPEGEDPSRGMRVIRQILETLYQGHIIDINASVDTAGGLPLIIDEALRSTSGCPFLSYEDSLIQFARAIYQLRLEDGRCQQINRAAPCGFIDPHRLYPTPPADYHLATGATPAEIVGSIPSSSGIDLVEVALSPSARTQRLKLVFSSNSSAAFHIEIWKTRVFQIDGETRRLSAQAGEPISAWVNGNSLELGMDALDGSGADALGLIIIRIDSYEETETTGAYSIVFLPE